MSKATAAKVTTPKTAAIHQEHGKVIDRQVHQKEARRRDEMAARPTQTSNERPIAIRDSRTEAPAPKPNPQEA